MYNTFNMQQRDSPDIHGTEAARKGGNMGTFSDTETAREYFKSDLFATNAGMQLDELTEDSAVCSVAITKALQNANGGVMGGAIFTLADLALAAVANNIHSPSVASQVSINYLSAPKGTKIIAKASVIKSGRTTTVIRVDVTDDTGRDVALFVGTAFKL